MEDETIQGILDQYKKEYWTFNWITVLCGTVLGYLKRLYGFGRFFIEGKVFLMEHIREGLAEYAHMAWSGWMKHLFKNSQENVDGSITIPAEYVINLNRQMNTPYQLLSESEKDSDRKEADRILGLLGAI